MGKHFLMYLSIPMAVMLFLGSCGVSKPTNEGDETQIDVPHLPPTYSGAVAPIPTSVAAFRGSSSPIPEKVRSQMRGISMPEGADISFDELAYLTVPYYNYQGQISTGHMVVNVSVAEDVLDIFSELFAIRFPIERMEPIEQYADYIDETFNSLDRASMGQNNTSAFCYRLVSGKQNMSYHAYGLAIDLNPRTNPYCIPSSGYVSPANAYEFADREQDLPGMIHHGDQVYQIFIAHGWEWGGDWNGEKDYQHFQKTSER